MADGDLGAFLRSRRGALTPEDAGLAVSGPRRVPGLRRAEAASLAGVSNDYYTRLEQGRERRPSPHVLASLARVFGLDEDQRGHLFRLAGQPAPTPRPAGAEVAEDLRELMRAWPDNPAMVLSPALDVLARNRMAAALFSGFPAAQNLARVVFLEPDAEKFYVDWDEVARLAVGSLRLAQGSDPADAGLTALLADLAADERFARLWRTQFAAGKTRAPKRFLHPDVGPITLVYQAFDVRGGAGQQLLVYRADDDNAAALRRLGELSP
ncbi:helix-turn-helix transcriptional regulator [Lentzea sp. NPDC060358]|uniref:helix-turn-helix transcriptional regulator n=1 Tax=Lentzea sp. NPDC060358 TaxID=3347103 RepID=UPI00365A4E32